MRRIDLLAPVDPARLGTQVRLVSQDGEVLYRFLAFSRDDNKLAVQVVSDVLPDSVLVVLTTALRVAPLHWVEDTPIYPMAKLWHKVRGEYVLAVGAEGPRLLVRAEGETMAVSVPLDELSLEPALETRRGWVVIVQKRLTGTAGLPDVATGVHVFATEDAAVQEYPSALAVVPVTWMHPRRAGR